MAEGLIQRLLNERVVKKNQACKDNVIMLGDSLIYSFGIIPDQPTAKPDVEFGYQNALSFLSTVCGVFNDPTHIVRIAPFANAYLGKESFQDALDVIVERAKSHPAEQEFLDEIFTGAALVSPEKRDAFLDSVRKAPDIANSLFGVGMLVSKADPTAAFTSPDEFPAQFQTYDVTKATEIIGAYVELGLFTPGLGFTRAYNDLMKKMGSLSFLASDPSPKHALFVGSQATARFAQQLELPVNVEHTPVYDARPKNTKEYPSLIVLDSATPPADVERLYKKSTVLYFASNKDQVKALRAMLGDDPSLIDASGRDAAKLLSQHVEFVAAGRSKGETSFASMLESGVREAALLARAGNEHFYDVRDSFEDMGRRSLIDEALAREGIKAPPRTDYSLIILLSENEKGLRPLFRDQIYRKRVQHYRELPKIDDTGMPFVIITNSPIPEKEILKGYPSATVLYVAQSNREERAIMHANGNDTFVVNVESMAKLMGIREPRDLGIQIAAMFTDEIAEARGKGTTSMTDIVKQISGKIQKVRDEIVYAQGLHDYYRSAVAYWNLQERYRGVPIVAQMLDGVLMETCPTGGCLKMTTEPHGGCGANYGRVLIDFAIAYRKQVGEERFIEGLTKYHGGRIREPWYFTEHRYRSVFRKGLAKGKADMTF